MKKDYIFTFISEFAVLAVGILVYRLAVDFLGEDEFSIYALSKRTVFFIQPALLLGLGIGIPRYMAYSDSENDRNKSDGYFIGGIVILVISTLAFTSIFFAFKLKWAFLLFGDIKFAYLILPINIMILGLVVHLSCYSYFRGRLLMAKANIMQLINLGTVPVVAVIYGHTTDEVLTIMGVSWLLISFVFLLYIVKGLQWDINIYQSTKEIFSFGVQRVPGDFGLAALLALPAIITAHLSGVKEAGYVAFATSLFNMAGSAFAPVGLILLPKASQLIAEGDMQTLKHYMRRLIKISLILSLTGLILFEIFADKIIDIYLGRNFFDLVLIARTVMIGSVAYVIYVSLKSIIDAYYKKAVNTRNILLSLALFLGLSALTIFRTGGYINIAVSFITAIFLLGALTAWEIVKITQKWQ